MIRPRSPSALLAGCALVVAANGILLALAAWNRSGARAVEVTLSERELTLPAYRQEENTGLFLSLALADDVSAEVRRVAARKRLDVPETETPWLDREKLRRLGIRADDDRSDVRPVFLALEIEGPAWSAWLQGREESVGRTRRLAESGSVDRKAVHDAEALLELDRAARSRLVPVDAGNDARDLAARYPDRNRYLIVPGLVAFDRGRGGERAEARGRVAGLLVPPIRVPRELRPRLAPFLPTETEGEAAMRLLKNPDPAWPRAVPARYRAVVAFGRRNEPWLVSLSPIEAHDP